MIVRDITQEADGARRLDTTSALRSFASPLTLVYGLAAIAFAIWMMLNGTELVPPSVWPLVIIAGVVVVSVTPLLTLFLDHLARSPLRRLSAFLAMFLGGLFQLILGIIIVALALSVFFLIVSAPLRDELGWIVNEMIEDGQFPLGLSGFVQLVVTIVGIWFLWRASKIEALLATPVQRSLLMGDVSKTGVWQRIAYLFGVPSSMWRAGALLLPSFYLFVLARVLVYAVYWIATQLPTFIDISAFDTTVIWVSVGIFFVVIALAHGAFILAKRLAARSIWSSGSADDNPPILFLRSFEDDQFSFRQSLLDPISWWLNLWSFRRNADEMMIDEFAHYGPVIALGQPDEDSTPFGAQRQYASHANWQETIRDAADNAGAIVVAVGSTPGLKWEYDLLKREGYLNKTVFLFPPRHKNPENFEIAKQIFEEAIGPTPKYDPEKTLLGVWLKDETPRAWQADAPFAQAYLVLLREFMQTRFKARKPSINLRSLLVVALCAFVILTIVLTVLVTVFAASAGF